MSSAASLKLSLFQPKASITTCIVARSPEPGLPMLTRLPARSFTFSMPESARAMILKGSVCIENTARSFLYGPCSANSLVPL
ncbi:Uncharacterised protein [Vibrio cholerae]|nr:Uncharacterised protein [Vibrio cholerae]